MNIYNLPINYIVITWRIQLNGDQVWDKAFNTRQRQTVTISVHHSGRLLDQLIKPCQESRISPQYSRISKRGYRVTFKFSLHTLKRISVFIWPHAELFLGCSTFWLKPYCFSKLRAFITNRKRHRDGAGEFPAWLLRHIRKQHWWLTLVFSPAGCDSPELRHMWLPYAATNGEGEEWWAGDEAGGPEWVNRSDTLLI